MATTRGQSSRRAGSTLFDDPKFIPNREQLHSKGATKQPAATTTESTVGPLKPRGTPDRRSSVDIVLEPRSNVGVKKIRCMEDLMAAEGLEAVCRSIFDTLGKQQPERAYQRALEVELTLRGVKVEEEVPIRIMYRETEISSRRIDLLLTLADASRAIVETKAVKTMGKGTNNRATATSTNYAQQIEYYMAVANVGHGFLVNFPHEAGFPPAPGGEVYSQDLLCGLTEKLSDMQLRDQNKHREPEVIHFGRIGYS